MRDYRIKTANILYMIGIWGFLISSLALGVVALFAPDAIMRMQLQISSVISLVFFMLPSMLVLSKKTMEPLRARFALSSVKPHIGWIVPMAMAGFLLFTGLNGLVMAAAEALGVNISAAQSLSESIITDNSALVLVLLIGVLPAVSEEFLFRGVVLPAYEARGKLSAVLISAILFASMHGQPLNLPVHFALGCVLGYIAMRSGSIYPAMLYHGLHNTISSLIAKGSHALISSEMYSQSLGLLEEQGLSLTGSDEIITLVVFTVLGAALFALFMWGYIRGCKRHGVSDMMLESMETKIRFKNLPLIIGAVAAVALNVFGLLSYFQA